MKLPNEYKQKLRDENIGKLLLNKENIPILEHILEREILEFKKLKKIKKSLDFGPKIKKGELQYLFDEVKQKVDSFCDMSNVKTPELHYFNVFKPFKQAIDIYFDCGFLALLLTLGNVNWPWIVSTLGLAVLGHWAKSDSFYAGEKVFLKKEKRVKIIPTIAHEYAHCLQDLVGVELGEKVFTEGYALGIERYISKLYRDAEDNPAFIYELSRKTIHGLVPAYKQTCHKLKLKTNENLLRLNPFVRAFGIGDAFFYIKEQTHGERVYRDVLHGEFKLD